MAIWSPLPTWKGRWEENKGVKSNIFLLDKVGILQYGEGRISTRVEMLHPFNRGTLK